MLSIRDANSLAQRGQTLEAASTYALLLFTCPNLGWSTIGGLERCLNSLREREDWKETRHEFSGDWAAQADRGNHDRVAGQPCLPIAIEQACQHSCATLIYRATPFHAHDLLLGLLHRQL